ncbi:MAG TPA: hypothetical protein VFK21_03575 [Gammaproteobacteria bacterium]|nr:hypothetical protein [Gammaproteobacteria bacterium]
MHRFVYVRVLSSCFCIIGSLCIGTAVADTGKANPYLIPQLQKGQIFANVFSKALEVRGEGFEPYSGRYSGTEAYKVLDPDPSKPTFDTRSPAFDKPDYHAIATLGDGGQDWCEQGKCTVNRQTSGPIFNPLLWGMPDGELKLGQTWQVTVTEPWEIGPAGKETVRVVSLDPAEGIVTLERDGNGTGKSQDDERKLSITVKGKKLDATVVAGPSTWSGLTTVQHGLILNDEILIRRPVSLQTEAGTFSGEETEYTLLNLMPAMGISYSAG